MSNLNTAFEELFADPARLGELMKEQDRQNYAIMVRDVIKEDPEWSDLDYLSDADETTVNHRMEITSKDRSPEQWAEIYKIDYPANTEPSDDELFSYITEDFSRLNFDVIILDEPKEWEKSFLQYEDLQEIFDDEFDATAARELIPQYAPDYEDRIKEGIKSEGFPDDVPIDELDIGLDEMYVSDLAGASAALMDEALKAESFEDYANGNMMLDLVKGGFVEYEITNYSEPADFQ